MPALASADGPAITLNSGGDQYFNPATNNDQDNTATISYCLSEAANVTITVANPAGSTVRTLAVDVSEPSGCASADAITWNGLDDAGNVVPDGVYTVSITAVDSTGATGSITTQVGVDTRTPGVLTAPASGASLSGSVGWVFTPSSSFPVASVAVVCSSVAEGGGQESAVVSTANADKTFSGTLDTTGCPNGSDVIYAVVSWIDPFGMAHSWDTPSVAVTVQNTPPPPTVTISGGAQQEYFNPADTSGQDNTATVDYCPSVSTDVTATVANSAGTVVDTIQSGTSEPYTCNNYYSPVTWNGTDTAGAIVPDGVYTITITAQDAYGQTGSASTQVGVDTRTPGVLTAPASGASLSGSVGWVFTPSSSFPVASVAVVCSSVAEGGGQESAVVSTANADKTFSGTLDTTGCPNGSDVIYAVVSWIDPFGMAHSWDTPSVAVTVQNTPPPPTVTISGGAQQEYFNPADTSGQDNTATVDYCPSVSTDVTATVANSAGTVVDTIQSGTSEPYTCNNYYSPVTWNGTDTAGAIVPDGVYTITITAQDAYGQTGSASTQVGVDTRTPGVLTAPASGASLSGSVGWVFTPSSSFPVASVAVVCSSVAEGGGQESAVVSTANADKTFSGTLDTTGCPNGSDVIYAVVSWIDPFGMAHSWDTPSVAVTVQNTPPPPTVTISGGAQQEYFNPADTSGQDNTATVDYCPSVSTDVTATVANSAGTVVDTIQSGTSEPYTCNNYYSPVTWNGTDTAGAIVPDGVYTITITAQDAYGQTGSASTQVGVDTRTPGVLTAPASGANLEGLIHFIFTPTPGINITAVYLTFSTGGSAEIYNASPDGTWQTTMYASTLQNGPAILSAQVQYTDPFGAAHDWSLPTVPVTINTTALPLTLTATPTSGPTPLSMTFQLTSSDPDAGAVQYTLDFGDGTSTSGHITPPYGTVTIPHTYTAPGQYEGVAVVGNATGAAATASVSLNATASGPTNVATPTLSGTLQEGDTATASDGRWSSPPDAYGYQWLRCAASGSDCQDIPGAAGQGYTLTAADVGDKIAVRETASDAAGISDPVQSTPVGPVTTPTLTADAGEPLSATAGSPVTLDGSASTPPDIISGYSWNFGDGTSASGDIIQHTYTQPGHYTATLTVTSTGGTATATTLVTVTATSPAGAAITVKDTSGDLLSGATVVYVAPDGSRISATSDGSGVARLEGLPTGSDSVYAWADGYQPAVGEITVNAGSGSATVTLSSGSVATSSLSSQELSLQQIEAAGINPNDPANKEVFKFEIDLAFTPSPDAPTTVPPTLSGYINGDGEFVGDTTFGPCSGDGCGVSATGGGSGVGRCSIAACYWPGVVAVPGFADGHPLIEWLVLKGQATVLKQFFSVSMVVTNLSPQPFTLANGSATLSLPGGLSLAPTPTPQTLTQTVPTIAGSSSADVNWIVRGDDPGLYYLSAQYNGTLKPIGAPIALNATLQSALHVWGAEALSLSVHADSGRLAAGQPYHVAIGLTNKADVPFYNVALGIDSNVHANFDFEPDERFDDTIGALNPGQTLWSHTYILAPDAASVDVFNPALSTATFDGQQQHPAQGITAVSPPTLYTISNPDDPSGYVHLRWQRVSGATGYEVFSTPDLDVAFPSVPLAAWPTLPGPASAGTGPATQMWQTTGAQPVDGQSIPFTATPVTNGETTTLLAPMPTGRFSAHGAARSGTTVLPETATDAYVATQSDRPQFYAVSTILDGHPTLDHDVVLAGGRGTATPAITVDDSKQLQPMAGFGATLNDSSAYVLARALDTQSFVSRLRLLVGGANALQAALASSTEMKTLFSTTDGIGLSYVRISIGGNDFSQTDYSQPVSSTNNYTEDDPPLGHNAGSYSDKALSNFNIDHDELYLIPALKAALKINPSLQIVASPWTAPAWMKCTPATTLSGPGKNDVLTAPSPWIVDEVPEKAADQPCRSGLAALLSLFAGPGLDGGTLKPGYEPYYAQYLADFVKHYWDEAQIPIAALTIQNEPLSNQSSYPSMTLTSGQEEIIATDLRADLTNLHLPFRTRILGLDHNWSLASYGTALVRSPAGSLFDGIAFHCYGGDPSMQSQLPATPALTPIYETECSPSGDYTSDLEPSLSSIPTTDPDDFAEDLRNNTRDEVIRGVEDGPGGQGSRTVMLWNMAADSQYGPTVNKSGCLSQSLGGNGKACLPVEEAENSARPVPQVGYYVLGQVSKFVHPGYVHIGSTQNAGSLWSVAFEGTPPGSGQKQIVLVVLNYASLPGGLPQPFSIDWHGESLAGTIPPSSVQTYVWNAQ